MADPQTFFDLSGKVALITGASSGLGRQSAKVLAAAGARVVAVARREHELQRLVDELGSRCAYVTANISERSAYANLAKAVTTHFGTPNILVHAAGLNPRQPANEVTDQAWDATISLNLSAPFFLSKLFIEDMKQQGWGRIVNFASLQSTRAFPLGIAYGASKGGITQLTRAMAEEWSPYGINVNAIGPGFFPTELTKAVFDDPNRAARNAQQTCIGRNGVMDDIDGPLLFLCSDASRYVTGQTLMVDGGFTAK